MLARRRRRLLLLLLLLDGRRSGRVARLLARLLLLLLLLLLLSCTLHRMHRVELAQGVAQRVLLRRGLCGIARRGRDAEAGVQLGEGGGLDGVRGARARVRWAIISSRVLLLVTRVGHVGVEEGGGVGGGSSV